MPVARRGGDPGRWVVVKGRAWGPGWTPAAPVLPGRWNRNFSLCPQLLRRARLRPKRSTGVASVSVLAAVAATWPRCDFANADSFILL